MPGEYDNLPSGETDNTNPPTALDNPENLNFYEPGEELDNQEVEQIAADPEREPDEIEETDQESDQPVNPDDEPVADEDDEAQADEADAQAPEITDDILVPLGNEKLPLSEIKAGYLRQADYSRKTQELGNKRRDLEALSTRVTQSVNAVAEFLQASIPKAPDPNLAISNPAQYVRDKALHDTAMAQVAQLIEKANAPKDVLNTLTDEQRKEVLGTENAKLVEAFPTVATPEGRKKFFESTTSAARELGFTDEELAGVTDHRMFKLAHYAKLGLAAEQAKAKATQKVASVPPVAPPKRPQANAGKSKNREAMSRLNKSGSIHDAMAIDFD